MQVHDEWACILFLMYLFSVYNTPVAYDISAVYLRIPAFLLMITALSQYLYYLFVPHISAFS